MHVLRLIYKSKYKRLTRNNLETDISRNKEYVIEARQINTTNTIYTFTITVPKEEKKTKVK